MPQAAMPPINIAFVPGYGVAPRLTALSKSGLASSSVDVEDRLHLIALKPVRLRGGIRPLQAVVFGLKLPRTL